MEAEYIALSEAVKELLWLIPILTELSQEFDINLTIPRVLCDNESAIHFTRNAVENHRSKHIDIRYHFVRDKLSDGLFELQYVSTKNNMADIFTKALNKTNFSNCIDLFKLKEK